VLEAMAMITLLFEVVDAQTPPSEAIEHLTGGIVLLCWKET